MVVDYNNGKIYAIRSYQTNEIYIGSTTQKLCKRMGGHRSNYKKYKKTGKKGTTSCEILKFSDAYIELIELFPCTTKVELHKREGQKIREIKCVNRCIAGNTHEEWRSDNPDKMQSYYDQQKVYRLINNVNFRKIECSVCGNQITKKHKKTHQKTERCKSHLDIKINVL